MNYNYTNGYFLDKDSLPPGEAKKIKGADFEVEFTGIEAAIASKMDASNPVISGNMAINTTLPPWNTSYTAISLGPNCSLGCDSTNEGSTVLATNIYYNAANQWITRETGISSFLALTADSMVFSSAASVVAGAVATVVPRFTSKTTYTHSFVTFSVGAIITAGQTTPGLAVDPAGGMVLYSTTTPYIDMRINSGSHAWRMIGDTTEFSLLNAGGVAPFKYNSSGYVSLGKGFYSRAGVAGPTGNNVVNLQWTGTGVDLWVDGTNLGTIVVI